MKLKTTQGKAYKKKDKSFQDFTVIMAVLISCIFVAFFAIFFFCSKDLVVEISKKTKYCVKKGNN